MVNTLANAFRSFRPFRALVLGDFVLDAYTTGRVKRISPEAPVPVMEVMKQESRPGGAGNAVLNLIALGGSVVAMGRIGSDESGCILRRSLEKEGADIAGLFVEPGYKTPVKNRLIADSQQLLRIDFETIDPLSSEIEDQAIDLFRSLIVNVQVVAISDYGKGFLSNRLLAELIALAKKASVPTIIDPKGIDFTKYRGASLIKPNLSEAYAAARVPSGASLDEVAAQLFAMAKTDLVLITRSEAGMSLFDRSGIRSDFPVRSREVKDVTGAGDTVLAMLSFGMANDLPMPLAIQLANIAAGIAIERLGCVQVSLGEIAERLLEIDCYTKIFDESHTFALQQVLKGRRSILLVLEKGQVMTGSLYRTIRKLSFPRDCDLVIYLRDAHPDDDFIHLLSSLHNVKTIILHTERLQQFCAVIQPQEIVYLEGDQMIEGKERLASLIDCAITAPPRQRSPS